MRIVTRTSRLLAVIACALFILTPVMGFGLISVPCRIRPTVASVHRLAIDLSSPLKPRPTSTSLLSSNGNDNRRSTDGRSTGLVLMGIVLALCIWLFSIPTEFRRAHICSDEDAAVYEQCWTLGQWTGGVADYYKNGGGVNFDFSIDPATLEENAELQKELFGR